MTGSAEAAWDAETAEYGRWTGAAAAVVGPLVQPVWIALDAVCQPEHWVGYLVPRALLVVACTAILAALWRVEGARTVQTLVTLTYVVVGVLVAWTVPQAGAAYGLYVLGFSLVVWAGGSLLALPPRWAAALFGGLFVGFLVVHGVQGGGPDGAQLFGAASYVGTAAFLCAVSAIVRDRSRRAVFDATWALSERNRQLAASKLVVVEERALSAAKNAFLARMSHELRTPLNAILGYAELAEECIEDGSPEDALSDLAKVRFAGQHLLGLVGGILDLTAIEAGQVPFDPTEIDVLEIAGSVADEVRPAAAHKSLTLTCEGSAVRVFHDPARVRQVVAALLSNAVKFTDTGSITIVVEPEGDGARLAVTDTGPGMAPEMLARVGEIFEQGDGSSTRVHDGSGLGLAVAFGLARTMGWRLEVTSVVDEGSMFALHLPARHPGHQA